MTALIVLGWLVSLLGSLSLRVDQWPWWSIVAAVCVRTQLQTGLFIVGHDAMHGSLWPAERAWNQRIGALVLMLYAALPYEHCRINHAHHHKTPGTAQDPDFAATSTAGMFGWYWTFMSGYLSRPQMGRLLCGWGVLAAMCWFIAPQNTVNVLLFCTLPLVLSSIQLFVVGTYLPHRVQRQREHQQHPDSLNLAPWLSLLACFHFGYHRAHHEHPQLPWFELPGAHQHAQHLALSAEAL